VLKKTAAAGGLLITAAAGALVTCSPVFAQPTLAGQARTLPVSDHTSNWSGNENESFNHIRLRIHNRNNNVAVARTHRRERERERPLTTVTLPPAMGAAGV
jgi:hypothetical protein